MSLSTGKNRNNRPTDGHKPANPNAILTHTFTSYINIGKMQIFLSLFCQFYADWTVVGAHYVVVDICFFDVVFELTGHHDVIDPPAHIPCPGVCPVCPPGVVTITFSEHTERVYKATGEHIIKAFPFFIGKAVLAYILFRVG